VAYPTLEVGCRVEENEGFEDEATRFCSTGSRGVGPEGRDEVRQGVGSLSKNRNNFLMSPVRVSLVWVIEKRATQVPVILADALGSMRSRSINADEGRGVRMPMQRSAAAKVREVVLCGRSARLCRTGRVQCCVRG
jgi:hypothetical protein